MAGSIQLTPKQLGAVVGGVALSMALGLANLYELGQVDDSDRFHGTEGRILEHRIVSLERELRETRKHSEDHEARLRVMESQVEHMASEHESLWKRPAE